MTAAFKRPFSGAFIALTAAYFFFAAGAAVQVAIHEVRCSEILERIAQKQDLDNVTRMDVSLNPRLMGALTAFFLKLTNPHEYNGPAAVRNEEEIVTLIQRLRQEVVVSAEACLVLLGFSLMYLIGVKPDTPSDGARAQSRLYSLLAVSLLFFTLGIGLPVLTAVVKGQHMLVGGFIIQTASKGIVSTVHTLFKSGDWIIAVLLAAFSIAIPIFKGIAAIVASVTSSERRRASIGRYLEAVGKWALTDVLVAAVLLGCFSLNAVAQENGGITAVPRFGFGFFVLYCVLATRTTYVLRKVGRSAAQSLEPARVAVRIAILAAALGSGALLSYRLLSNFTLGRQVVDMAIVKLVRTHTELTSAKHRVRGDQPLVVPFEVPFRGKVRIEAKAGEGPPLEFSVMPDFSDDLDVPKPPPAVPVPAFAAIASGSYERSAFLPSGKYKLTVADTDKPSLLAPGGRRVTVHITLDP